jgi:phage-related protein (TIGR01555 family)
MADLLTFCTTVTLSDMTSQAPFKDSLQNLVSGMGTDRDKSSATTYVQPTIDRQLYTAAYRGAWLPRRVVSQVSEDAFRKWREWQAEPAQISALEATEKRLDLRNKAQRAYNMARLYGVAYLYISVKGDEGRQEEPLNPERVKRGGINLVQVLMDSEVAEGEIDTDPLSPGYGMPRYYEIAGAALMARIHPSRMVVFYGAERPQDWVFGREADSVLTATLPAIKRHDSIVANVASLVFESRVDVITVPGLADLLTDPETEAQILRRFALMSSMKGNNGLVLLNGTTTPGDPTEEWQQKNATFTTLPDIIEKAQEEVSAAARIPRAILFGTGAGGLGATGDLELSAYYDYINTIQTNYIETAMYVLDECLIRDALGARPTEVHYRWASLWQQSDKERAELADKLAGSFEKIARAGIIPAEVMTQSVVNAFTEAGILPGLEQDYNDWIAAGGMENMQEDDLEDDNGNIGQ